MRTGLWTGAVALTAIAIGAAWQFAPGARGQEVRVFRDGDDIRRDMRTFEWIAGDRTEIGATVADRGGDAAKAEAGVIVEDVRGDGPAAKAGLKAGDVITAFDGERVRSARQFERLVEETASGRSVPATIERDGKRIDIAIVTDANAPVVDGRREAGVASGSRRGGRAFRVDIPDDELRSIPDFAFIMGRPRLGVSIQDLTPELAAYFGVKNGVLVSEVSGDSPAQKAGVKAGDVITTVNGQQVNDGGTLRHLVDAGESTTRELTLGIVRDKKEMSVKATLDSNDGQQRRRATRRRV